MTTDKIAPPAPFASSGAPNNVIQFDAARAKRAESRAPRIAAIKLFYAGRSKEISISEWVERFDTNWAEAHANVDWEASTAPSAFESDPFDWASVPDEAPENDFEAAPAPEIAAVQNAKNIAALLAEVPAEQLRQINITHVLKALREHARWVGKIRLNEFTHDIEIHGEAYGVASWDDDCTTQAMAWFCPYLGVEPSARHIERAVSLIAKENRYHPVRDWLDSLEWDGVPRIERLWADYFHAEHSVYNAATSAKFLIGAVARIYDPGCKRDEMVVLESNQGKRKSSGLKALFSAPWFTDTGLDLRDKDSMQTLQGKWLIEFAELVGMHGASADKLKNFLSSGTDRFRPPYGKRSQDFPRQQVFVGSTNDEGYLNDPTGARRFWPVCCGKANPKADAEVEAIERDRGQLFAEAVVRYKTGEIWHLTKAEEALALVEQAERQSEDPWDATLAELVESQDGEVAIHDCFGVLGFLLPRDCTPRDAQRIGKCLTRLGLKRVSKRDGNSVVKVYRRP